MDPNSKLKKDIRDFCLFIRKNPHIFNEHNLGNLMEKEKPLIEIKEEKEEIKKGDNLPQPLPCEEIKEKKKKEKKERKPRKKKEKKIDLPLEPPLLERQIACPDLLKENKEEIKEEKIQDNKNECSEENKQ